MKGHGSKFGRKKEEAIAALLTQRNIEEAAKSIGIGTQTLIRWLKMPEFQTEASTRRRSTFLPSARLRLLLPRPLESVEHALSGPKTAPQ